MGEIAYFSMEVGISHDIPTYSGGLGVLAGDTLKSFADNGVSVVAVTLLNEKGYFHQDIDNGNQIENPVNWDVSSFLTPLKNTVSVTIDGRQVKLKVWKHIIKGSNGEVPLYFLDSNVEGNSEFDRTLTSFLYGGDRYYRLCQEVILGVGGMRMLDSLGHSIKKYHMNEGHAALLTVELLKKTCTTKCDEDYVREKCVFTTHTPVAAGHDRFELDLFRQVLGDYVPKDVVDACIDDNKFNMTLLGLHLSKYVNGVAKRHGEVTRQMFPEHRIGSITNGIHPRTWASTSMDALFDKYIPGWSSDPYTLRNALSIPRAELLQAHDQAKGELISLVNNLKNVGFDQRRFTIGFARRFTAYKRPDLLLHDMNRLLAVADKVGDIQVIFAGKAHKNDTQGKEIIKRIIATADWVNGLDRRIKMVFLEQYDMHLARKLVSGCDIWLNNPQRPHEASGTSGMKAALNGVPQISTLDGWWIEGHMEGLTGWSIGPHPNEPGFTDDVSPDDEADDLYRKLEEVIVPTFYGSKDEWLKIMAHCIAINASFFNTHRMVQQYLMNAYFD